MVERRDGPSWLYAMMTTTTTTTTTFDGRVRRVGDREGKGNRRRKEGEEWMGIGG